MVGQQGRVIMSTEVAPPLAETLKKKPNKRFASVKGGVDAAQVDAFLVAIASSIEALEAKSHELEVIPPPPAEDAAEGSSKAIERIGEVVEREIEKMLAEARGEAATMVSQAGEEADGLRKAAEGDAARSLEEARMHLTQVDADARRIPSDAAERRQQMIEETQKMQERLLRIATELDLVVKGGS
jgi:cell division septum initiation protein DivIVA